MKFTVTTLLLITSFAANAGSFEDYARVISVQERYSSTGQRRQVCNNSGSSNQESSSNFGVGTAVGAVAGGLLGAQVGKGIGVDFHPWRDAFFLDSFRDDLPAIYAARSTWAAAYCADKLAYSDSNIASVPTFSLNGREYINDGGYGRGNYYECEGWTFRPLADWCGPTFSYRTQCKAWDEGRLERGDRRGLVVSVRGQHCVLDGVARVYDDKATGDAIYTADEEDAIVDEDFEALTCSD